MSVPCGRRKSKSCGESAAYSISRSGLFWHAFQHGCPLTTPVLSQHLVTFHAHMSHPCYKRCTSQNIQGCTGSSKRQPVFAAG